MLNTLEIARTLTDTGLKPDQAAAISHAVQQAAEHGKHVTPDEFKAGIAELRAEIAEQRAAQRGENAEWRAEVRRENAELRFEVSRETAALRWGALRSEIRRAESRIIKWVVASVLAATGIVTATGVTFGLAILRALEALAAG